MTDQVLLPTPTDDHTPSPDEGSRWLARWADWRFPLIGYIAPVVITILATLTWFSWGRFAATADIPPFVRDSLAGEVTGTWSHQTTGAGSTSAAIVQLIEVVLIRGAGLVGLGAPFAQWLLYVGCFALCTFGAAYLAGAWVRRPVAVAAAGLLASFNVYLLVWLPNPLPSLAIGLTGLLAGMTARAASGRRISPLGFAAATVPVAYVALNPPWLLVAILSVLLVAVGAGLVGGRSALRRAWSMLIRALPWAVLFNLWWIVPFAQQLLSPAGQSFSAVTDIRDWAWTHSRNTVTNVVTLNAHWAWNAADLFPYAQALGSGLRAKLHWLFPLLALAGVVLATGRRRRLAALLVAAVGLVLLFLSTGLRSRHVGWVNLWLYDHVPGMWLIRDPASKLGVPTVLIYSSLAALAIDRVIALATRPSTATWLHRFRPVRHAPRRLVSAVVTVPLVAVAAVVLGALAYPSPMWTGSALPDSPHHEIPGTRVTIPAGWYRLADTVNRGPGAGKILTLPVNLRQYTVTTNWGYRGVDIIPAQLLKRPTLHLLPAGYYSELPVVKDLITEAQDALLTDDREQWRGALAALGVDTVIVRHDLKQASFDGAPSADADQLDAALAGIGQVNQVGQFGVATLYRVADPAGRVSAAGRPTGVQAPDPDSFVRLAGALPDDGIASTDPDQPVEAFSGAVADSGDLNFTLANAGPYRFERTSTEASYRATVAGQRLRFTDADTTTVDGRPLPERPALEMGVTDPNVVGLDVDGHLTALPAGGDVVTVGSGTTVTAYAIQPGDPLRGPFRAAADCGGVPNASSEGDPLRLAVEWGRTCAAAPVDATGGAAYQIRFRVRSEGGAVPRVCLWQEGPARCATLPAPAAGSGWVDYTAVTRLSPNAVSSRLYLYAERGAGPGVAEYRDVTVARLRTVGTAALKPVPAPPLTVTLPAGRHTVTMRRQVPASVGTPEYAACADPDDHPDPFPAADRWPRQPDGTVLLATPDRIVCTQGEPVRAIPGATYRFSADYRSSYGQTPQVCVWLLPAYRCADTPALTRSTAWQTVTALVRPPTGVTSVTPRVIAAASPVVRTSITYRNVSLTRVALATVQATPADPRTSAAPRVDATVVSASRYKAAVRAATGQFTLVMPESYASGWALDGLPRGWTARHVVVDGYANGWLVTGTGNADLNLVYKPSRWSDAALVISALAAASAVLLVAGRRLRRAARRRRTVGPAVEST